MRTSIAFGHDVWTASIILAQKINASAEQYQQLGKVAPRAICFAVTTDGKPTFTLIDSLNGFLSITSDSVENFAVWLESAAQEPLDQSEKWTPIHQGHWAFGHAMEFLQGVMAFDHKFTETLDWWIEMADAALDHRSQTQPEHEVLRGTTEGA